VLPLESARLVLRRFAPDDVPALVAYRSDPEVARYQSWESCSLQEAAAFVEKARDPLTPGKWFQIAFALGDSGALIGDCGLKLHESEPRHATVGITLSPEYQHCGLASEGLSCLFDDLFTRTDVRLIVGDADPDNVPSWRLLERLGMRRERHLRANLWFKGRWADSYVYAILREDWLSRPRTTSVSG
jgi:RimJ/RimL family protein N-acetyltransferase